MRRDSEDLAAMWDRLSELWCKSMHSKAMWPIHGKYVCPTCLREYPVIWEEIPHGTEIAEPPNNAFVWSAKAPLLAWMGRLKRFGTM